MNDIGSYEKLMTLPLFMGFSQSDLSLVAGQTRFDFRKYEPGEIIAAKGMPCDQLRFLSRGEMKVVSESEDKGFRLEEMVSAPQLLQPERLYGLNQRLTKTFFAQITCNTMGLHKREVARLCREFELARLNLVNIIATRAQRAQDLLCRQSPRSPRETIALFLERHSFLPSGRKTVFVKVRRLGEELHLSRRDLSAALHQMEAQGLLRLYRGRMEIPAMERLLV